MRRHVGVVVVGLAVLALVGTACSTKPASTPNAQSTTAATLASTPAGSGATVNTADVKFTPRDLTVQAGTTVTWTFSDGIPHTVTSAPGASFDSGTKNKGDTFTFTFTTAGTYRYYCKFHGTASGTGMAGIVTVTA